MRLLKIGALALAGALLAAGCKSYTPSQTLSEATADPPPLTMEYLGRKRAVDAFLVRNYFFKMSLKNRHAKPMWFVIRLKGNKPLNPNGVFPGKAGGLQPFRGMRFDGGRTGGRGRVVRVDMLGEEPFSAFYLPPHGTLSFEAYKIASPLNFHEFEVWEAPTILVNMRRPLKEWLPFDHLLADKRVVVTSDAEPKNLNYDPKARGMRQDFPKKKVELVYVQTSRKYTLKLPYDVTSK